ncbi:hypothetical protein C0216_09545 [Streptomyces globosus]|uniref:DUF6968 domain-containing protein n=1 Tax=Streptomyces globosus TaxID=68209 RepID=A0A344TYF2_9ACTN|nr:hypothetical protein [Streptomyces globosus]AXE23673.1 hypothetical protein C0216_09545 [Streptomyces globosus]
MTPAAHPLGTLIADRRLEAVPRAGEGAPFPLALELGAPYPDPDPSGDWICPCRIDGLDGSEVHEVHGIDGIQALTLAADLLRRLLAQEAEERGLTFTWLGEPGLHAADVLH